MNAESNESVFRARVAIALTFVGLLLACSVNVWAFRIFFDRSYVEWYSNAGPFIALATAAFGAAWGGLDKNPAAAGAGGVAASQQQLRWAGVPARGGEIMRLAITLLAVACAVPDTALAQTEADRAAVLQTLNSWTRGWTQADASVAVEDYAEDVDWTNAFGDRFQGRDALRKGLEHIFSLDFVMAGTSAGNEFTDVTFLTPDVALIRSKLVRTGQQRSSGSLMPDRHVHHLRVVQRRDGRWQIVSHLISQAQEKR